MVLRILWKEAKLDEVGQVEQLGNRKIQKRKVKRQHRSQEKKRKKKKKKEREEGDKEGSGREREKGKEWGGKEGRKTHPHPPYFISSATELTQGSNYPVSQ